MTQPDKPWQRRSDWASGQIKDSTLTGVIFLWVFALFWNVFIGFLFWGLLTHSSHHKDKEIPIWFLGIFVAAGLLILWLAVYMTMTRLKYGKSVLDLQTLPVVPGGILAGTIRISRPFFYREPIHLSLGQYRHVQNGKDSQEIAEWQDILTLDRFSENQSVSEIPVYFKIPPDAKPRTSKFASGISWRLDVKAKTAGVHYSSTFQVPVFQAPLEAETLNLPDPTAAFRSPEPPRQQPLDRHIHVTQLPGRGCQIEITPGHTLSLALFLLIFGTVFASIAMNFGGAPIPIALIFCLFGTVSALAGLRLLLLKIIITVRHDSLTVDRDLPLFKSQKQFRRSDITDIVTKYQGAQNNKPFYLINAIRDSGAPVKLCGLIYTKNDADWLAEQIKKSLWSQ